jgi:glycosyltransferase involved in cell wall biosynthesis
MAGDHPSLSVVMPVFNAMPYLDRAIESILEQSFADFEFVIGDDGSTDGSWDRILHHARRDPRIRAFRSPERLGPVGSSNWTARLASAPVIARMDADDIAHRDRLRTQMALAAAHPGAVLIGSLFDVIDGTGRVVRPLNLWGLMPNRIPAITHTSILYRQQAFEAVGGYCPDSEYFEDTDLYLRLARQGQVLMIAAPLVQHRVSTSSARLNDDPALVEQSIGRYFQPSTKPDRVPPEVFVVIGTLRLWSGYHPGVLGRMLRRMEYRPLSRSLRCFARMLLSTLSPAMYRALVLLVQRVRNWRALKVVRTGHVYQWREGGAAIDLGPMPM